MSTVNPTKSREMFIIIETDDDWMIDGKGFYDGGYNATFPLKEEETLKEGYDRWLTTVNIETPYKNGNAKWAREWLEDVTYVEETYLEIPGGNWSMYASLINRRAYDPNLNQVLHVRWEDLPAEMQAFFVENDETGDYYLPVSHECIKKEDLTWTEHFVQMIIKAFDFGSIRFDAVLVHMNK